MVLDIKYKKGRKGESSYILVEKYKIENNCLYIFKHLSTIVIPLKNIEKITAH